MKVAIAYYSQHHGNTRKLLDAIQEMGDIELINVADCEKADLSGYDAIGFASGTYFGKLSKQVIEFARNNLPDNKRVFLINTYGARRASIKELDKIFTEKSCKFMGIYGCRGFDTFGPLKLFGGIAKGHPDEKDINGAKEFFRRIMVE